PELRLGCTTPARARSGARSRGSTAATWPGVECRAPLRAPPCAPPPPIMLLPLRLVRSCVAATLLAAAAPSLAGAGAISTLEGSSVRDCPPRADASGMESARLARDASCYVTARELARWRGNPELVIVDTRSASEFREVRIPGSINLPLRSLLSRPYL